MRKLIKAYKYWLWKRRWKKLLKEQKYFTVNKILKC
ncbi:MAG: hypothetical protein A4E53_01628 [Pelotomaculum sp. PtaB.Bin104]|nr:MAG: hypothetical protein A4E53_01628 [Pelotomaculum sp. PtaB.Bin104]OPY60998.1 MAG: hypothetical protein A4E56_02329 [Pelotomaculum sp. PtaU1.Bin065]